MDKFKFKLQKLLEIRKEIEDKSQIEFKKVMNECLALEQELEYTKKEKYDIQRNEKCKTSLEFRILNNYLNTLDLKLLRISKDLEVKRVEVENKRKELIKKQTDRKTVEKLKEKQETEFFKEANAIEQNNNDEFALYGFIRNHEGR